MTIAARPFSRCISQLLRASAELGEPLLEQRHPVVAPELLAVQDEQRHAEHVVGVRLFDARLELLRAVSGQELAIGVGVVAELADQRRHLRGLVDLEPVLEEAREHLEAVALEEALALREQAPDQRRRGVVDLARAADQEPAAPVRPAPRVQVRIARLPLGIDAALAGPLDLAA